MRESKAWRRIASEVAERGLPFGLCYEMTKLGERHVICPVLEGDMSERVQSHLETMAWVEDHDYYDWDAPSWGWDPGDAGPRVLAALFLALEAEDEGR